MLPAPHARARERTLADMLKESRLAPSVLPPELKSLLRKLGDSTARSSKPVLIGHVSSEILLPAGYGGANKSTRSALRPATSRARPQAHLSRAAGRVSA
jgi:hypothetical protein